MVTGLCDMLGYFSLFDSTKSDAKLMALNAATATNESGALMEMLDAYLAADGDRQKFAIAGCFIAALEEKRSE